MTTPRPTLADLLEQQHNLPLPDDHEFSWYLFGGVTKFEEQKAEAARLVRLLPGTVQKCETGDLFRFKGQLSTSMGYQVIVDRPAVCEQMSRRPA